MDWTSRRITAILENALREDSATRDATTYACIDPSQRASATILAKEDCVLAGLGAVARIFDVFAALDGTVVSHPEVTTHGEIFDGVRLHKGQQIAVIRHNARVILSCERVILNALQRMSGIATLTRRFVDLTTGTKARILDTRKTVPGMRVLDKYAVRCGGGMNHRLDLSDGVLIKNNHIALAGGIAPALERALRNRRGSSPIEIEVRALDELEAALEAGAEDFKAEPQGYEILTEPGKFEAVHKQLEAKKIKAEVAEVTELASVTVSLQEAAAVAAVTRLIDALEDHDDVKEVYSNAEFPDEAVKG